MDRYLCIVGSKFRTFAQNHFNVETLEEFKNTLNELPREESNHLVLVVGQGVSANQINNLNATIKQKN